MDRTNFENLKVYQLSESLADSIWDIAVKWHQPAKDTVGKQVIRSSDSIGANIAEGSGRASAMDNRRFARVARGSLYETKHWLRRAFRRKLLTTKQVELLRILVDDLTRALNGYIRSLNPKTYVLRPKLLKMTNRRPLLLILTALSLSSPLSGCAWVRGVAGFRQAPPPCVLAADSSKEDIVAHLNENSRKLTAWKTDKASIWTRGKG